MKPWLALNGDFTERNGKIVFYGGVLNPPTETSDTSNLMGKHGILLFEDMLSNGEIEATVEFESFEPSDEAEILFNY